MFRTKIPIILVLTAMLVVGTTVPAASAGGVATNDDPESTVHEPTAVGFVAENETNETNDSSVNVTVGQQLSTVVAATSDDVQADFENTAFEVTYESANETERVEVIAQRAEELRDRVEDVREDYRDATAAYRAGELNRSEYGQRIAVLNARAQNLLRGYDRLQDRVENVSAFDLQVAGVNRTALNRSVTNLDAVTGTGPAALLDRYTGQTEGELRIDADRGLRVEIENEAGERSLEVDRQRDDDYSITVDQSAALETARSALGSAPGNATWALTESSVHTDSGYYRFRYDLMAANAEGEAEVRVDGSSGELFRLEQEIERDDERERSEREDDERRSGDDGFALVVTDGTPAPNETITVTVLATGDPVANATVYVDGSAVGSTDEAGTATLTLPPEGATVEAVRGDREAELEFEFESESERDGAASGALSVSGRMDNGTVTVSVAYRGTPVADAAVFADGDRVGTTDADGTVTFATDAREDLEVAIEKGEFEAEVTFVISGDTLTLSEEKHEGADDAREDERETEHETEDEDERETEDEDDDDDDDDDDDTTTEEDDDDTTTET